MVYTQGMIYETEPSREADNGPHASGWQPGDHDKNTDAVIAESEPSQPGIARAQEETVIAGLRVGPSLLAKLRSAGIEPDDPKP